MRLHCRSCDTRFEVPAGEKPRCPNCLRTLGLDAEQPAGQPAPAEQDDRGKWVGLGIACCLLAVAGVLAAWLLAGRGPAGGRAEPGLTAPAEGEQLGPTEAARRKGQALRLVAEGRELLQSGKLREANARADEAFRLAPVQAEVRQLRGEIYRASGAFAEAASELVAALSAEENADRHLLAGEMLAAQGEAARAEQHFRRARALDPQGTRSVLALALLYQATGKSDELAALRQELGQGTDGGASPLLQAVDEGLHRMEEERARRMEELRRRLEAARAGEDGAPAAAAGGTARPGEAGSGDDPVSSGAPDVQAPAPAPPPPAPAAEPGPAGQP